MIYISNVKPDTAKAVSAFYFPGRYSYETKKRSAGIAAHRGLVH